MSHAALRDDEIVVAAALQEFCAFCHRTGIDRHAVVQQLTAVSRHPMDDDWSGTVLAAPQISLSVAVPEGAGVFPFRHTLHQMERRPRAVRVAGGRHKQSLVGRTEIDVEASVVIADGRRPRAAGIVLVAVPARLVEARVDLTDVAPVHHIVALEHLHAEEVEVGGHHIVLLANADDVGVGEVGVEHRIAVGAVALIAPSQVVGVHLDEVRTGIGLFRQHLNIVELDVAGMTDEETLGGQRAPHRGLRVLLLLLIPDGIVDMRQVGRHHAATVVQADVRERDVLHRVSRQAGDAAAHSAGITNVDVVEMHAIDAAYVFDGNEFGNGIIITLAAEPFCGSPQLIAPSAIAQTDEDGRLRALDADVRDADVLHHAAVDNLQRDGRRANLRRCAEELARLVVRGFDDDAADTDITEAAVGLRSQLHGVAMTAHHTVGNADILAETR